jgi:transposase
VDTCRGRHFVGASAEKSAWADSFESARGFERDQFMLLPEAVDDFDADNPVRFIDAFVDGLDLAAAGFSRVTAKATGRPGYAPGDLLKLYIYGYLNRVRSSRRLEREAHRNIELFRETSLMTPCGETPIFRAGRSRMTSGAFPRA